MIAVLASIAVLFSGTHISLPQSTIAYWKKIGACETGHIGLPSDGPARWDWGSKNRRSEGRTYQGGVGFYHGTWDWWAKELKIHSRYPEAYKAPMLIQIMVADYGWKKHRGYWGCMSKV